jgi:hypothetical protein
MKFLGPNLVGDRFHPISFAARSRALPLTGRILSVCLPILVLPSVVSAPSVRGALCGRIVDGEDRPVAKAIVAVISAGGKVRLTTSNTQGEYAIRDLDPGRYAMWATQGNVSLFDQSALEIGRGQIETINISLETHSRARPLRLPPEETPPMELALLLSSPKRAIWVNTVFHIPTAPGRLSDASTSA